MNEQIQLFDPDEAVLLKQEFAIHVTQNNKPIELYLTNKNIVAVGEKKLSFGRKTKEMIKYPLSSIKIYENEAQALITDHPKGMPFLDIYFISGQESFAMHHKKDVIEWVKKINELLTGEKKSSAQKNDRIIIPGADTVAKALKGTIDTYKDTFKIKKKSKTVKCPNCGAPVSGTKGTDVKCSYCGSPVNIK